MNLSELNKCPLTDMRCVMENRCCIDCSRRIKWTKEIVKLKDEARPFKSYSEVKAHFCKILFNL